MSQTVCPVLTLFGRAVVYSFSVVPRHADGFGRDFRIYMSKREYFAIVDTETTVADTVADFAIIICDRMGNIYNQCAVMVMGHYDAHELFYDKFATGLWSRDYASKKRAKYDIMLAQGSRMMATPQAINRWIERAIGKYNPTLTAYNLAFDKSKCANTSIDIAGFNSQFCLWQAAVGNICHSKRFRQFALDNHQFNRVTEHGNMTFKTNAEVVCGFIQGEMREEPHTALEDAKDFELPILTAIARKKAWRDKIKPYAWQDFQVKNNFTAK